MGCKNVVRTVIKTLNKIEISDSEFTDKMEGGGIPNFTLNPVIG